MAQSTKIDWENVPLDTIPDRNCDLVIESKEELYGQIDLQSLTSDLGNLGRFIRLAYNGVAGHTELQIQVQHVGNEIADLIEKIEVTVHRFKTKSRDALKKLKIALGYLMDGREEMAIETLSCLAEEGNEMKEASEKLKIEIAETANKVYTVLVATQRAKGAEEERESKMRREQNDNEKWFKMEKQKHKDAMDAEDYEDEASGNQKSSLRLLIDILKQILVAGVAFKTGVVLESGQMSSDKEAIMQARKEKMKYQQSRRDANQRMIEFSMKIRNCKDESDFVKISIAALHNSIGALKDINEIMKNAQRFWGYMECHCGKLAKEDVKKQVKTAMTYDKEERLKVWMSKPFKRTAIEYLSQWVALEDVCTIYKEQIKTTREDLYRYLRENPTKEQSFQSIEVLAISFENHLKKDLKEIKDKEEKIRKDIEKHHEDDSSS